MVVSGITFGRRSETTIRQLLERATGDEPDYDHVGSTLGAAPPGVGTHRASCIVAGELSDAVATLARWAPHGGIGARIVPDGPPELGATVCVVIPFGPVELCVPDRIVLVVDDGHEVGFAYGTLPGHPERGEELFHAEELDGGRLRLSVVVHAVPASVLARLAAPVTRLLQRAAARRYLDAWAAAITARPPGGGDG